MVPSADADPSPVSQQRGETKVHLSAPHGSFKDGLLARKGANLDMDCDSEEEVESDESVREDDNLEQVGIAFIDRDDTFELQISDPFERKISKPWKKAVVAKLMGRPIGYKSFCERINSLWRPEGGLKVVDLERNYFLVSFDLQSDASHALLDGPWMLFGRYLVVQPWSPEFTPENDRINKVAAWIRFPGLAMHLYHKKVLRAIGNKIGKLIRVDFNTSNSDRGKFARIAVELDLTKPLLPYFFFRGKMQTIVYEGLPAICFHCGMAGHAVELCGQKGPTGGSEQATKPTPVPAPKDTPKNGPSMDHKYGPWMVPQRRGRKPAPNGPSSSTQATKSIPQVSTKSRFTTLSTEVEECDDDFQFKAQSTAVIVPLVKAKLRNALADSPSTSGGLVTGVPEKRLVVQDSNKRKVDDSRVPSAVIGEDRVLEDGKIEDMNLAMVIVEKPKGVSLMRGDEPNLVSEILDNTHHLAVHAARPADRGKLAGRGNAKDKGILIGVKIGDTRGRGGRPPDGRHKKAKGSAISSDKLMIGSSEPLHKDVPLTGTRAQDMVVYNSS